MSTRNFHLNSDGKFLQGECPRCVIIRWSRRDYCTNGQNNRTNHNYYSLATVAVTLAWPGSGLSAVVSRSQLMMTPWSRERCTMSTTNCSSDLNVLMVSDAKKSLQFWIFFNAGMMSCWCNDWHGSSLSGSLLSAAGSSPAHPTRDVRASLTASWWCLNCPSICISKPRPAAGFNCCLGQHSQHIISLNHKHY